MLIRNKSNRSSLMKSLNAHSPKYLENLDCGFCLSKNSLQIHSNYPSLEVNQTTLYICAKCTSIYNSTTEKKSITNEVAQVKWLEKQSTFNVPTDAHDFNLFVEEPANIFRWFFQEFDYDASDKIFFEIGAGSGLSSVAASRYFAQCITTDLTLERLLSAKKSSNAENLSVISTSEVEKIEFDFFFAWHVFEHLINPGQVLIDAFSKLSPGGVMFMQVPLVTERYIFPEHIYMLNQYSWTNLLSKLKISEKYFFYDTELCSMTIVVFKK
jgi:hypothetical protein